jgi:hypothetical protein
MRSRCGFAVVGLVVLLGVLPGTAFAVSPAGLARLDPGARIGANTLVGSTLGERLVGVPRPDFVYGLGGDDTIVGGGGNDQLGGGAGDDRIVGGLGDELIFGGPGDDQIYDGPGNDVLIDDQGATTVHLATGENRMSVADGSGDDRVLCSAGSGRQRIDVDRGDRVDSECRRGGPLVRVRLTSRRRHEPVSARAAAVVNGDGSTNNPLTAECDDPSDVDCSVSSFARRSLTGFWANEYVPADKCPPSHPWLLAQSYSPAGTSLIEGVAVQQDWPWKIGVSITGDSHAYSPDRGELIDTGTATGFLLSSATNWTIGTNSYQVILHCTSNPDHGSATVT